MSSKALVSLSLATSLAFAAGSAEAQAPVLLGAPTVYALGPYDQCLDLSIGDVNGDGWPDVVVPKGPDVKELLGRGGAAFDGPLVAWTSYPNWSTRTALADLDADGRLDLVVAGNVGASAGFVSSLQGHGDGTFGMPATFPIAHGVHGLLVADLSGDGVPDLAVVSAVPPGTGAVTVLLGLGGGDFATPKEYPVGSFPISPRSLAVGDFNSDGVPDLVVSDAIAPSAYVLMGQGGGAFGAAKTYSGTSSATVAVGDVDGDAKSDIVVVSYGGTLAVLPGVGDGSFGPYTLHPTSANQVGSLGLADLNGDGFLDVALASSGTDSLVVLSGDGAGDFGVARNDPLGGSPWVVRFEDFSNDGTPDVAVADLDEKTVAVLLNQGPNGDPWTWFGFGFDGGSGIPSLTGSGPLVAGTPTTMTLSGARPSSPAALFISPASQPTPFKGGALVTVPVVATLAAFTDGVGSAQWVWPAWPADVVSGTALYFQCVIVDPAAPKGLALSSALQAVSP